MGIVRLPSARGGGATGRKNADGFMRPPAQLNRSPHKHLVAVDLDGDDMDQREVADDDGSSENDPEDLPAPLPMPLMGNLRGNDPNWPMTTKDELTEIQGEMEKIVNGIDGKMPG